MIFNAKTMVNIASKQNFSEVAASLEGILTVNYFRGLGFDVIHYNGSLGSYYTFKWG